MPLPTINTFFVDETAIGLYWKASPKSNIRGWNLYGAPSVTIDFITPNHGIVLPGTAPSQFTLIKQNLPNCEDPMTPGSCYIRITRQEVGIGTYYPYYFLITALVEVTPGNIVESAMEVPNVHGVPYADDYVVDEAGWPCNVVYKEFEFDLWPLSSWSEDRYLDIVSLLGRPARGIKIDTVGAEVQVRFNSIADDAITIRDSSPYIFDLKRGELLIDRVYVHNPTTNDATVRIFVAA